MIDLTEVTPPPVLSNISSEELLQLVDNKEWEFFKYPNHTQAVERTVKLVTEVSSRIVVIKIEMRLSGQPWNQEKFCLKMIANVIWRKWLMQ